MPEDNVKLDPNNEEDMLWLEGMIDSYLDTEQEDVTYPQRDRYGSSRTSSSFV